MALPAYQNDPNQQFVAFPQEAFTQALQYRSYVLSERFFLLTLVRLAHQFTHVLTTPLEQFAYLSGGFLDHIETSLTMEGYDASKLWRLDIGASEIIESHSRALSVMYPFLQPVVMAYPQADNYSLIDYGPTGLLLQVFYDDDLPFDL